MAVRTPSQQDHRYQLCRDESCDRFPCRLYKEGHRDGWEYGHQRGLAEGYADGYAEGFPDGLASCPGPHNG